MTNPGGVQPAITYSYDALGDITYKSDTGTYSYGGGAGPHAVTSISGPAGGSYAYDANGNMTNRNGTTITWNSDNLPVSITQSASNASSFSYAPDKHRYYQSAQINGVAETTVYAGAFEAVTTGGVTKYRYHLSADSREVAEVDLSNSGSTVNETVSYVLSDHLGSVDVVRTYNAATGALLSTTNMSFSAWGGRREPNTWLPPVSTAEAQADHNANRYGFTHHEMLDNVGIIHMNGRIYDPNLGRFLSVDPVFEFPTNTQSLNPYSYVLNNPLSMTDPTGYQTVCIDMGEGGCIGSGASRDANGNLFKNNANQGGNGETNTQQQKDKDQHHDTQAGTAGNGDLKEVSQQSTDPKKSLESQQNATTDSQAQASLNAPKNHTDGLSPEQLLHSSDMSGFVNPTGGGVRNDPTGGGYFGSQRLDPDGTVRLHMATDFLATPGQDVEAPISGKVRNLIVYREKFTKADPRLKQFRGVAITGVDEYGFPTGYSAKLFYVSPTHGIAGKVVHARDVVGTSQNRAQFTHGMENHVHMELYLLGQRVDPLDYIRPNH